MFNIAAATVSIGSVWLSSGYSMNAAQAGGNSAGCVTTRDANNNVVTQCP